MRLGISLSSSRPDDGPASHAAGARSIIGRARLAKEAGLDTLALGDQHATPAPYYQNVPMLGRLLAEWDATRPTGCLFLLPLWHPVVVAEQVATLATMSEVPFVIQTGIGSGGPQFGAMGGSLQTRGADLEEAIRVIGALLAGGTVSSERFELVDARISPRPPHGVEWWIGAGVPKALRRAAALGDAWYTDTRVTAESLIEPMARYAGFCEEVGRTPRTIVRKDVLVLDDGARARRLGSELIAAGYRGMSEDHVVVGGIDDVASELARFADLGVDEVMIRCMHTDDAVAAETIACCGRVRQLLA